MASLKRVEIKSVRGVRLWDIALNGKSLVIYGENGSGKSSVVDALEFLFTGQVRHLAGTRGLSLSDHCPNVDVGAASMRVTAAFDPGAVSVSRALDEEPVIPATLAALWPAAAAGTFILRRSQLLEFIYADPADRFRAIGAIIGLGSLDEVELAFMRARDRLEGGRATQENELRRSRERLAAAADGATQVSDALIALNRAASELAIERIPNLAAVEQISEAWLSSARSSDQNQITALQLLARSAEAAQLPHDLEAHLAEYQQRHSAIFSEREKLNRVNESALLETAERVLAQSESAVCPLCEQPIDLEGIRQRVSARLRVLQELSEEVSDVRRRQQVLSSSLRLLSGRLTELARHSVNLGDAARVISGFQGQCDDAVAAIETTADFSGECNLSAFRKSISEYERAREEILKYAESEQGKLALSDHDRSILSLVQRARSVTIAAAEIEIDTEKLTAADEAARRANVAYSTFSSTKKEVVRNVYLAIQADIRHFYETLHPDDLHHDFELIVAEGRRASTELRITSFGTRTDDPRAFVSEGHLDSLGLCIFLAFAKGYLGPCPLLVLDDVVTSIDASHRGRIAQLLLHEFGDRQVVITTHDPIWFEEIRRHQQAYGVEGRFLNIEIQRWTLIEGPVVREYRPKWEAIEAKLNDSDKTGAANDGRQLLEWILYEVAVSAQAKVALKRDGRYVIGDLEGDVRRRLQKLLPEKSAEIEALFQEIDASAAPGNLLSHSNANAQSLSVSEIRRFCVACKALVEWYTCPSCQRLPAYIREAKLIRCQSAGCGSRKEWGTC